LWLRLMKPLAGSWWTAETKSWPGRRAARLIGGVVGKVAVVPQYFCARTSDASCINIVTVHFVWPTQIKAFIRILWPDHEHILARTPGHGLWSNPFSGFWLTGGVAGPPSFQGVKLNGFACHVWNALSNCKTQPFYSCPVANF